MDTECVWTQACALTRESVHGHGGACTDTGERVLTRKYAQHILNAENSMTLL